MASAPIIVGAGTDPDANRNLYDGWASNYEADVRSWGYNMPEKVAETVKELCTKNGHNVADLVVLDAGAGDGLSGVALRSVGFSGSVVGIDLSPELIAIAQTNSVYSEAAVADLSQPLQFNDNEFDLVTVVGVMTYLEPDGCSLDEMTRVTKSGGIVCFTHRTDKVDQWTAKHAQMVTSGKWKELFISEPLPYLPGNPDYADKVKVMIHCYQVNPVPMQTVA